MKRNYFFWKTCLLAGLTIAIMEGCSKEAMQDGPISTHGVTDTTNTIGIMGNRFSKPDHWVGRNYPVTWVNRDVVVHSVAADNGTWSSGPMQSGTSFTRAFGEIGSFGYHDDFSSAKGVINVFGRED